MKKNISEPSINLKARYILVIITIACLAALIVCGLIMMITTLAWKQINKWQFISGCAYIASIIITLIIDLVMIAYMVNYKVMAKKINYKQKALIVIPIVFIIFTAIMLLTIDLWAFDFTDELYLVQISFGTLLVAWGLMVYNQVRLFKKMQKCLKNTAR